MATWRKVIVSGSSAELTAIGVGLNEPKATAGTISASNKIYASSSLPASPIAGELAVLIKGANGEIQYTGSNAIAPSLAALTFGDGLSGTAASFNGSTAVSFGLDTGSIAGSGITAMTDGSGIEVNLGDNLMFQGSGIAVDSASLADTARGISASAAGLSIKIAASNAHGLSFNGSGQLSASFVAGAALTAGSGIRLTGGATDYDGTAGLSISVDTGSIAGEGLTAASATLQVKGASSLTDEKLVRWDNGNSQFVDSTITDTGTAITLGAAATTVTIPGNLTVVGTASFQHSTNVSIADSFLLMSSGSTSDVAFGIIGQTGSAAKDSVGWQYNAADRFGLVTGSVIATGEGGVFAGFASLLVNTTDTAQAASDPYMAETGNFLVDGSDNVYVYF